MKRYQFLLLAIAALVSAACGPKYANKAEKVVAEMHDPNSKYVVVVAHRGDWRNYPENSIPAIESVIRMGVDIVEIDLKMTSDSVLVLSHDATANRTTTGKPTREVNPVSFYCLHITLPPRILIASDDDSMRVLPEVQ